MSPRSPLTTLTVLILGCLLTSFSSRYNVNIHVNGFSTVTFLTKQQKQPQQQQQQQQQQQRTLSSQSMKPLFMASYGRSSPVSGRDRSKRQERVGHVVRTEIASILQLGYQIKNGQGYIDDDLRRRINVVNADVSPDLRQARITVSIIKPSRSSSSQMVDDEEDEDDEEYEDDEEDEEFDEPKQVFPVSKSADAVVDRRRAYSWLVKNTKQIRHALSQRLKHMKTIPNLTFVQADVGAAVDVMNLIEKVSSGDYKRENLGVFGAEDDNLPEGMYLESELEGDGWIDDDYEDFDWEDEEEEEEEEEEKEIKSKKNNEKKKKN